MANPRLPGIPVQEEALLYNKLSEYNQRRASYKEVGAYLVVLPRPGQTHYTLWLYSPFTERQPLLYVCELSPDVQESLRMASTMFFYSRRCLYIVAYNEKRMLSKGDDLIAFGKYRGHFLHEILRIDPSYLTWIANMFTPKIPKQERFLKIARAYYEVHLDLMRRKNARKRQPGNYLGEVGKYVKDLELTVKWIRLEDDPYKTRIRDGREEFYVRQLLTLYDAAGNWVKLSVTSRTPSGESATLSGLEHAFRAGEVVRVASAKVTRRYESRGRRYTCLGRVKFAAAATDR